MQLAGSNGSHSSSASALWPFLICSHQHVWAGERDEAALTAGLDDADTLIVREILKQLEGN